MMTSDAGPTWDWADRLRKIRRGVAGLSQAKMAQLVGVKPTTYSAWENGRNQPNLRIAYSVAKRIEDSFPGRVSAAWVLGFDPSPSEPLLPRMDSNHQPCGWRFDRGKALRDNPFQTVRVTPKSQ